MSEISDNGFNKPLVTSSLRHTIIKEALHAYKRDNTIATLSRSNPISLAPYNTRSVPEKPGPRSMPRSFSPPKEVVVINDEDSYVIKPGPRLGPGPKRDTYLPYS